jgi:N-acetylglucosaminyl-diphospho-decaprenol L-rhamnosyltransferase
VGAVGVVTVCYESHRLLPGLLRSLAEHEPGTPVVVVDNASPSGPPPLDEVEPDRLRPALMVMPENLGYAAAANAGAAYLAEQGVRYLAFLNPDLSLTGPSLSELAGQMARYPQIAIASGPVMTRDGGRIQSAATSEGGHFWLASDWRARRTRRLIRRVMRRSLTGALGPEDELRLEGHILGGVMVVRLRDFQRVDGLDDGFFLYWEDADLCERIRQSGAEVRLLECPPFVHARTPATPGVRDDQRWAWYVDGARRFSAKHLPPGQALQLERALVLGRRLRQLRRPPG